MSSIKPDVELTVLKFRVSGLGFWRFTIDDSRFEIIVMKRLLILLLAYFACVFAEGNVIDVDFTKEIGDMKPIWAWFGYDEPNFTYMKDGKKLLTEIAALSPVPVLSELTIFDHRRWHAFIEMRIYQRLYREDANGNPYL